MYCEYCGWSYIEKHCTDCGQLFVSCMCDEICDACADKEAGINELDDIAEDADEAATA